MAVRDANTGAPVMTFSFSYGEQGWKPEGACQQRAFDFVDCLNIRQVYTFDQRDFTIFRPKHGLRLELVPR